MKPTLNRVGRLLRSHGKLLAVLILLTGIGTAMAAAPTVPAAPVAGAGEMVAPGFHYFSFLNDPNFSSGERAALFGSLVVALAALAYAGMLVKQVVNADRGTKKMQEIAAAIREGANAYL